MALLVELQQGLDDSDEPIERRLTLAKNAFQSAEILVANKENVILAWFCRLIDNPSAKEGTWTDVWKTLDSCFGSEHMKQLRSTVISPEVAAHLVKVITDHKAEEVPKDHKQHLLQILLSMCTTPSISNHLKSQPESYIKCIGFFFNLWLSSNITDHNCNLLSQIIKNMQLYFKQSSLPKDGIIVEFVNEVLLEVVKVLTILNQHTSSDVKDVCAEVTNFLHCIIVTKERKESLSVLLQRALGLTEMNNVEVPSVCSIFRKLASCQDNLPLDISEQLYALLLNAAINCSGGDDEFVANFFVVLCYLLGMNPVVNNEKFMHKKCFKKAFRFKLESKMNANSVLILKRLIQELCERKLYLDVQVCNIQLVQWLEGLMRLLFTTLNHVPLTVVELLCDFISFNPMIIQALLPGICSAILLQEKLDSCEKNAYNKLLSTLLSLYEKLNHVDKFVSTLLTCLKRDLEHCDKILPEDIFPLEFYQRLSWSVVLQPIPHNMKLMKMLNSHLVQGITTLTDEEVEVGNAEVAFLKIVVDLYCEILSGTKIADHTLPLQTIQSMSKAINEVKNVLGQFGRALLLKEHNPRTMVAFLKLAHCWGEASIMLLVYSDIHSENIPTLPVDTNPANLAYLHNYLLSDEWYLLTERIGNFGQEICRNLLDDLIIQKLKATLILEKERTPLQAEISASATKYLLQNMPGTSRLLAKNFQIITPYLDSSQYISLAEHIVEDLIANSDSCWFGVLNDPKCHENQCLYSAIMCIIFEKMRKVFKKAKRKLDSEFTGSLAKTVLSLMKGKESTVINVADPLCTSESDLASVASLIFDIVYTVNDALSGNATRLTSNGVTYNTSLILRCITLMGVFPVHYCSDSVKSLLFLGWFSVAITLEPMSNSQEGYQVTYYIYEILSQILDSHKPLDILDYMHRGFFLTWLLSVKCMLTFDPQRRRFLFKSLIDAEIRSDVPAQHMEMVKTFVIEKCGPTDITFDFCIAFLHRVHNLEALEKDFLPPARRSIKIVRADIINYIVDLLGLTTITPIFCEAYIVLLRRACDRGDAKFVKKQKHLIHKTVPSVERFVNFALKEIAKEGENSSHIFIELISVVLAHSARFRNYLPVNFYEDVVNICSEHLNADRRHFADLFTKPKKEQFRSIADTLRKKTINMDITTAGAPLKHVLAMWNVFVTSKQTGSRNMLRQEYNGEVCKFLFTSTVVWKSSEPYVRNIILPIFEFQLSLIKSSAIKFTIEILDFCLGSCTAVPLDEIENVELYTAAFMAVWKNLSKLLVHHKLLIVERTHSYLQRLNFLSRTLAARSIQMLQLPKSEIEELASCAYHLQRIGDLMNKDRKSFQRTAPYCIADILSHLEMFPLYPAVKTQYVNALYRFLDMCDQHGLTFLQRSLQPGSRTLFKSIYANYKKYHSVKIHL